MGFYLIMSALTVFQLLNNFKVDKGKQIKAKVFHLIVVTIVGVYFANSFRVLGWMLTHFDRTTEKFYTSLGWINPAVNLALFMVQLALSLVASIQLAKMTRRDLKARNLFLKLLPVLALSEAFSFYRSYTEYGLIMEGSLIGFLLGLFVFFLLAFGIYRLYNSQFMIDFFSPDKTNETAERIVEVLEVYELYWKDQHIGSLKETAVDLTRSGNIAFNPAFQNEPENDLILRYIQHSIQTSNYLESGDIENYDRMNDLENQFSVITDSEVDWLLISKSGERLAVLCPIFHDNNEVSWRWT